MLDLEKLADLLHRWSSIRRYSQKTLLVPENVAEHTAHVAFIAMLIARELEDKYPIHFKRLYELVLIHDLDEVMVGDIPRPTKEANPELKALIEKLEKESMKTLCSNYGLPDELYALWADTNDMSIEGRILNVSDIISVYIKAVNEYTLLGNSSFGDIFINLVRYISGWIREGKYESVPELESLMIRVVELCQTHLKV